MKDALKKITYVIAVMIGVIVISPIYTIALWLNIWLLMDIKRTINIFRSYHIILPCIRADRIIFPMAVLKQIPIGVVRLAHINTLVYHNVNDANNKGIVAHEIGHIKKGHTRLAEVIKAIKAGNSMINDFEKEIMADEYAIQCGSGVELAAFLMNMRETYKGFIINPEWLDIRIANIQIQLMDEAA